MSPLLPDPGPFLVGARVVFLRDHAWNYATPGMVTGVPVPAPFDVLFPRHTATGTVGQIVRSAEVLDGYVQLPPGCTIVRVPGDAVPIIVSRRLLAGLP